MSFVSRAREKLTREIDAYKRNKQLENDPEVVRYKLQQERETIRQQKVVQQERAEYERERAELKELQRQNSTAGKVGAQVKEYLASVQARKQPKATKADKQYANRLRQSASLGTGRNIIYDQSPTNSFAGNSFMTSNRPSLIQQDVGKPNREVFGHSGGVLGQPVKVKKPQGKGKTIVIKL